MNPRIHAEGGSAEPSLKYAPQRIKSLPAGIACKLNLHRGRGQANQTGGEKCGLGRGAVDRVGGGIDRLDQQIRMLAVERQRRPQFPRHLVGQRRQAL